MTAVAQFDDTCDTHNLSELRKEAAGKSSLLCQGVAYVAMERKRREADTTPGCGAGTARERRF